MAVWIQTSRHGSAPAACAGPAQRRPMVKLTEHRGFLITDADHLVRRDLHFFAGEPVAGFDDQIRIAQLSSSIRKSQTCPVRPSRPLTWYPATAWVLRRCAAALSVGCRSAAACSLIGVAKGGDTIGKPLCRPTNRHPASNRASHNIGNSAFRTAATPAGAFQWPGCLQSVSGSASQTPVPGLVKMIQGVGGNQHLPARQPRPVSATR